MGYITSTVFKLSNLPFQTVIVCVHLINCKIAVVYFFPIFNKTPQNFPILWVLAMFPKYWEKSGM